MYETNLMYGASAERPLFNVHKVDISPVSSYSLKEYQKATFAKLKNKLRAVLRCPTGWGKTKVIQFLVVEFLNIFTDWKVVILVPQKLIGKGFIKPIKVNVEGRDVRWSILHNVCTRHDGNKLHTLHKFLKNPASNTLPSRIAIATYGGFVRCCEKFGGLSVDLINKTLFIIDEGHHVQADDSQEEELDNVTMNGLGKFASFLLKNSDQNAGLWLATATFGRTNQLDIIPKKYEKTFEFENITFEEYWRTLTYLRTFKNFYIIYEDDPFEPAKDILRKKDRKTLIYCPKVGSRFLNGMDKQSFVEGVKDIVLRSQPTSYIWQPGMRDKDAIIDLTEDKNRKEKIDYIYQHPDNIYAIITVDMMKEGGDWPPVNQIIDFVPLSKSVLERIQKFGRGTRDHPSKQHFEYYSILPKAKNLSEADMREVLSESFGQLMLGLIEASYFCPIIEWDSPSRGTRVYNQNILSRLNDTEQADLLEQSRLRLIDLGCSAEKNRFYVTQEMQLAAIQDVIAISDYAEQYDKELLSEQIYLYWSRQMKTQNDVEIVSVVNDIGFDKISPQTVMNNLLTFASSVSDEKTLTELRDLVDSREKSLTEENEMCDLIRFLDEPAVLQP